MEFNEYFNLGVISKVFSFKGEVVARFDVDTPTFYSNLKAIFIEHNENLVPYFIEKIEIQQQGFARLKIKGINTEEEAKKIVRLKVYLPDTMLPKLEEDEFYFHEIIDYTIFDEEENEIGTVSQVYDLPGNPIIETIIDKKEVLIPLSLMLKTDKKEKKVWVTIPDGLLDI
jgi:16S rRNA processing protein RimM